MAHFDGDCECHFHFFKVYLDYPHFYGNDGDDPTARHLRRYGMATHAIEVGWLTSSSIGPSHVNCLEIRPYAV